MDNTTCVILAIIILFIIIIFSCVCIARIIYKNIVSNSVRAHKEWIDQQEKEFEKYKE